MIDTILLIVIAVLLWVCILEIRGLRYALDHVRTGLQRDRLKSGKKSD